MWDAEADAASSTSEAENCRKGAGHQGIFGSQLEQEWQSIIGQLSIKSLIQYWSWLFIIDPCFPYFLSYITKENRDF